MTAYKRIGIVPDVAKDDLNSVVKQLAARDRPAAVKILAQFGVLNTVDLKREDVPACTSAFTEALRALDAGSTP